MYSNHPGSDSITHRVSLVSIVLKVLMFFYERENMIIIEQQNAEQFLFI